MGFHSLECGGEMSGKFEGLSDSLGDFIIMIGILGGYVARKKEGPPGAKVIWKGMARMVDFALAWEAFGT